MYIYMYMYVYICICVCGGVCVFSRHYLSTQLMFKHF